jgi:hypothetical protein
MSIEISNIIEALVIWSVKALPTSPKPPKATLKPPQSLLIANRLRPQSHPKATTKLPQSHPKATLRLPQSYPKAILDIFGVDHILSGL